MIQNKHSKEKQSQQLELKSLYIPAHTKILSTVDETSHIQ